jgi:hypothetical protein
VDAISELTVISRNGRDHRNSKAASTISARVRSDLPTFGPGSGAVCGRLGKICTDIALENY